MAKRLDIEKATTRNKSYRKVLFTTPEMQLVAMRILPGEEIGLERHIATTQFIRIEKGKGKAEVGYKRYVLRPGVALIIPGNAWHNIVNTGNKPLHLYTLYSPPQHPENQNERRKQVHQD